MEMLKKEIKDFNNLRDELAEKFNSKERDMFINLQIKREFLKYPDYLRNVLIKDYDLSTKYFNFLEKKLNKLILKYDDVNKIKKHLFVDYKNRTNKIKSNFIDINNSFKKWFHQCEIIENYYGENKIKIDFENWDKIQTNFEKLDLRPNQREAFELLENNGLETGIHCQATGCGKTFIILRYLDYIARKKKNPKVILFTERVNILADLFDFDKNDLTPSREKLLLWKKLGIADLTKYNIIERVKTKNDNWINELEELNKPTVVVINRAYLTLRNKYKKIENIDLILHDECHNTSSNQCHKFLKFCKDQLNSVIVGFSATPLRTGKNDVPKLKEIYGDNKENLILLTDYNMIHAITKNLILPPNFYWYQMSESKKNKDELVSQLELGSIMELLNYIVPSLPNKKMVAWCRTIALAKEWKRLFELNYEQRGNLHGFKFGLDVSTNNNTDYNEFKKSDGYHILFCANKHREGSDIKKLDGCIFLDKVKKRSPIPFIQSIGRVLRIDPENEEKRFGVVIDGYVKNGAGYEKEFIDKIISYYLAIQNLTNTGNKVTETKYDKYIELLNIIEFDKEKETIKMNLRGKTINIYCNRLPWDQVINKFEPILQEKIKLSREDNFKHKGKILKEKFNFHKNTDFVKEYKKIDKKILEKYNLPLYGSDEYINMTKKSWFDFCGIKNDFYTYEEYLKFKDNKNDPRIPLYPQYTYKNISVSLKKIFF